MQKGLNIGAPFVLPVKGGYGIMPPIVLNAVLVCPINHIVADIGVIGKAGILLMILRHRTVKIFYEVIFIFFPILRVS